MLRAGMERGGLISIVISLALFYARVNAEDVCFSDSSSVYYCDDGFNCCDGNEKCCAEMNAWVIVGIAGGGVVFVAVVITVVCVILKKTNQPKVRVIQTRPGMQTRTNYMNHPGAGMMLPGQVMPPPPMYDPMGAGGSSGYGYNPAYNMDAEFERYGAMKRNDKFNKNDKKGASLGPDMTPAPRPLVIGRPMNGPSGGPMSMMEPPPYRSPTPSLSPSPEPPGLPSFGAHGDSEEGEHPRPAPP